MAGSGEKRILPWKDENLIRWVERRVDLAG